jgi:arylformamidase
MNRSAHAVTRRNPEYRARGERAILQICAQPRGQGSTSCNRAPFRFEFACVSLSSSPRLIDISVAVSSATPRWPGSPAFEAIRWLDIERGDVATDTAIRFSVHFGTHIDAPAHFLRGGATVEEIPLETLLGPCWVLDVPTEGAIEPEHLAQVWPEVRVDRVLLRTPNSAYWATAGTQFIEGYTALSAAAASWIVEQGVRLVGIDYLSIQRFADPPDTHIILLTANVVILEGLNLHTVPAGHYNLICLPIRLQGTEAAPVRALLQRL